jgi:magnesium chelatase subunit D
VNAAKPVFPFTAIVGQEDLKLALLLNAVSGRVGGVLIQGEKGNAKSTAVRSLAALLPPIPVVPGCPYRCDPEAPFVFCPHCQGRPWEGEAAWRKPPLVELPLGTTEDRLLGHPDLEALLAKGERCFQPGLLAQAHRGILYVDEVNLLEDHLVDYLLDAAASGWNRVEREGFSLTHPARFILVGTMNPEEGELRPQLLDRFGLAVEVVTPQTVEERMAVMERRMAFEQDPDTFCRQWEERQAEVAMRVSMARERLHRVQMPRERMEQVARIALEARTEGMRADLVICEAAKALAAYGGRDVVTAEDVNQAARLALFHRAREPWQPDPGDGGSRQGTDGEASFAPETGERGEHGPAEGEEGEEQGQMGREAMESSRGSLERDSVRKPATTAGNLDSLSGNPDVPSGEPGTGTEMFPGERPMEQMFPLDSWFRAQSPHLDGEVKRPSAKKARRGYGPASRGMKTVVAHPLKGRRVGIRPLSDAGLARAQRIDWAKSVYKAALHQRARGGIHLRPEDLQQKVFRLRRRRLSFFLIDASGSMASYRRMAQVKGAVFSLVEAAYRRREMFALVAFRNRQAELLLPPSRSLQAARKALEALRTGGNTPLALGLRKSRELFLRWREKQPQWQPYLVLFTDGRVNLPQASLQSKGEPSPVAEVLKEARCLAREGISATVIDTETGWLRLGCARLLAEALQAPVIRLDDLRLEGMKGPGMAEG